MQLSDYLTKRGISRAAFAAQIGVEPRTVNRYCAGDRIPHRRIMWRIIVKTGGAVRESDFYSQLAGDEAA